jgi:hypothetical protein
VRDHGVPEAADGGDSVAQAAGVAANGNREKSSVKKSINQDFFFIHCIYVSDDSYQTLF